MVSRQEFFWSALWIVFVLGFGSLVYLNWDRFVPHFPSSTTVPTHPAPKPPTEAAIAASDAELDQIREADKVTDRYQRCVVYPNPSEFNWDPAFVEASCRRLQRHMISWKEINEALDHNHPEVLQTAFASYEKMTTQAGQHGFLDWTFWWMFEGAAEKTGVTTQKWVDADPKSAFALTARGSHELAEAWGARGDKFIKDTPPEKLDRMHGFATKARADFEEALRRDPQLIAAYRGLIDIGRMLGDDELVASASRKALAVDPADDWIYSAWTSAMAPRWGGSYEKMDAVAREATNHVADNVLLKYIAEDATCDRAAVAACSDCNIGGKNEEQALAIYREAARSVPAGCFLGRASDIAEYLGDYRSAAIYSSQAYRFNADNKYLLRRANALQYLGKGDWAMQDVEAILKNHPDNVDALRHQGWLLEMQHRWREAEAPFLKILDHHASDHFATQELVRIEANELHDLDKARQTVARFKKEEPDSPRVWLLQAAIDREVDDNLCKTDLETYLALVDPKTIDEDERRDFDLAKKHLAEVKNHLGARAH